MLPFTNLSADEENDYFSDGLAEEILNALSRIECCAGCRAHFIVLL